MAMALWLIELLEVLECNSDANASNLPSRLAPHIVEVCVSPDPHIRSSTPVPTLLKSVVAPAMESRRTPLLSCMKSKGLGAHE
jgi:hypothetical protein